MSSYVLKRLKERLFCLPLSKKELEEILNYILTLTLTISGNVCVMVKKFDEEIVRQDPLPQRRRDNTLWVVFNDGKPKTIYRRGEDQIFPEEHKRFYKIEHRPIG